MLHEGGGIKTDPEESKWCRLRGQEMERSVEGEMGSVKKEISQFV